MDIRSGYVCSCGDKTCVCGKCRRCGHKDGLICLDLKFFFLERKSGNFITDRRRVPTTHQVVGGGVGGNASQEKKIEELLQQIEELKRQVRELKQQLAECTSASVDNDAQATEV